MFFRLYLILSASVDAALIYFCRLVDSPADLWKPVLIFAGLFIGFILLHFIAFVLFSLTADKEKEIKTINNFHRNFMVASLKLFFNLARVKVHIEGMEKIPDDGKFLFLSNHISIYDPIVSIAYLADKNIGFVSKKENLAIHFAGRYMAKAGCVALDRENAREAVKAINKAAQYIENGVCAMGIYPEGMVNKTAKGLLPFRNGAFKIVKKAKVPLVVAVISNTRKINENILRRRTDIYLKIVDVIPYENIAEIKTNEIGEKVRTVMFGALEEENK